MQWRESTWKTCLQNVVEQKYTAAESEIFQQSTKKKKKKNPNLKHGE